MDSLYCICGSTVEIETEIKEYSFYCPECDENLYSFEIRKER
jgi:predicted RNA-binding Zn-ribbon protein involved in translation (DUF1610 family)